jgi:hypothetical protein
MRFFHDAGESWLVSRAPGGQNFRLEPTAVVHTPVYPESLWPKGLSSGPVTAVELLDVDWDYHWYDAAGREGGGRTVRFREDGSFSRGETDNWYRWEIRRGSLYLFGVSGAFVGRFSYAAERRMLVGHTADDDYFVLIATP